MKIRKAIFFSKSFGKKNETTTLHKKHAHLMCDNYGLFELHD